MKMTTNLASPISCLLLLLALSSFPASSCLNWPYNVQNITILFPFPAGGIKLFKSQSRSEKYSNAFIVKGFSYQFGIAFQTAMTRLFNVTPSAQLVTTNGGYQCWNQIANCKPYFKKKIYF